MGRDSPVAPVFRDDLSQGFQYSPWELTIRVVSIKYLVTSQRTEIKSS